MGSILTSEPLPKLIGFAPNWLLLSHAILNVIFNACKLAQEASKMPPRGAQEAPRGSQDVLKRPQDPPRAPQEAAFKTALRAAQDQPKTFKIAKIAEIDESKRPCPNSPNDKDGRAAVIPLGEVNTTWIFGTGFWLPDLWSRVWGGKLSRIRN